MKPEDTVDVVVLKLEKENKKISLGYKQLLVNPWEQLRAAHPEGSVVEGVVKDLTDFGACVDIGGRITRVADFGVFVELAEGVEGLVHISELSKEKVETPGALFKEGDEVGAVVRSVDRANKKISLITPSD